MEALQHIKVVAMDKTGTITKGNFVLQQIAGSLPENTLLSLAAACESGSSHPIAHSILEAARTRALTWEQPSSLEEYSGRGIKALTQAGILLCGSAAFLQEQGVTLQSYELPPFGTQVLMALKHVHVGSLLIADTVKENAGQAVAALQKHRISAAILTGDLEQNAQAVASQTGIAPSQVYAGLLPQEKLSTLQKLRQEMGPVMFVGDGINDAPVLAGADVGAAMGNGADAAIEAADVVFLTSELKAIPESVRIAKTTCRIAMQNVIFALTVKAAVMVLGLLGYASMWFAVFADSGVAMLCVLNAIRILYTKKRN